MASWYEVATFLVLLLTSQEVEVLEVPEEAIDNHVGYLRVGLKPSVPNSFSIPLNLPALNSSSTLQLSAKYDTDSSFDNNELPTVFLTIMYNEKEALEMSLSHEGKEETSRILCFSEESRPENIIVVARTHKAVGIRLILETKHIELEFWTEKNITVTSGSPATFLVNPVTRKNASRNDRYLLKVESSSKETEGVCMIVAAYANACPFKNQLSNVRSAEKWFTALKKGTMTIKYEEFNFNSPFFVSIVLLESDEACHLNSMVLNASGGSMKNRRKELTLRMYISEPNTVYWVPIGFSFVVSLALIIVAFIVMSTKRLSRRPSVEEGPTKVEDSYYTPNESRQDLNTERAPKKKLGNEADDLSEVDVVDAGNLQSLEPMIDHTRKESSSQDLLKQKCMQVIPEESTRRNRIIKGLERLNPDATLDTMTKILEDEVWFRRNRSRVYSYLVPLLSLFYFIPAIQFVFLAKETESLTGSLDFCFHNFECSKPLFIFSDFNHIISNVSFMLYGVGFLAIVYYKASLLPAGQKPKEDHLSDRGILQQLSIFYAMGFALFFQGLFSICYHVCPTNHSLQFDTTMMYVMCMLGIVKIYQFRHPDANSNAYSFFYFLGGIILLEALALYSTSWWVYGVFLLLYFTMTVFIAIDCYFMGIGRLDKRIGKVLTENIFNSWKPKSDESNIFRKFDIKYPKRFGFTALFCAINFIHAFYITYSKWKNPNKTVSHVVLAILAMNLCFYIIYYVFRKNISKFSNFYRACISSDHVDSRYQIEILNKQIPSPCSAGSFFAVCAVVLGIIAGHFYVHRNANRNLSPAESRNLNEPCSYFGFYDNHDMWHFVGAGAIFMAFLALLTVDDDLLNMPRDKIDVF